MPCWYAGVLVCESCFVCKTHRVTIAKAGSSSPAIPLSYEGRDGCTLLRFADCQLCHGVSDGVFAGFACHLGTSQLSPDVMCSDPNYYCPAGSANATVTPVGYYAVPTAPTSGLYYTAAICSVGRYCVAGVSLACPPGRYGNDTGLSVETCTDVCLAGYYCASGSVSPTASDCSNDAGYYCPTVRCLRSRVCVVSA